jgi:membrane protein YqaA with SNARE-associated domain
MLERFVHAVTPLAQALGGPGLALVAFLDSSFLSFPEVPDALIAVLTVAHPARWAYYALMSTVGSVVGCVALFLVARWGGETFLRKRVKARTIERWFGVFRRYGLITVVLASILPPPVPFKIFILLAGAASVGLGSFTLAVVFGRVLRYFGEAWLVYLYGDRAMQYLNEHLGRVLLWVTAAVLMTGLAIVLWRRWRAVPPGYNSGQPS